tara:strand:+ start:388 stop:690 length:303 start_codon:yes stop_codon:yes gene_type:complete
MILHRESGQDIIKIKAIKCRKPKLNSSAKGATWDFCRHYIDGHQIKIWIETSWGEYAYFQLYGQWYKFRMQSSWREHEMNDNLDFGQEFNVRFSTKYGGK